MSKKAALLIGFLLMVIALPASAGAQVLSANSGDGNAAWHVSGEASLVINGFDLNSLGIQRPAVIDKVSISVVTPVAGAKVVVYGDNNGGSPIDAVLDGSEDVNITAAGTFTATLATPITVTQPVVWVGFYLPVGFAFNADTSGTSVLTYWAWNPGSTLDLNTLSAAPVLGPADGTAPVNINLNGIARITAEITGAAGTTGTPIPGQGSVDLGVMQPYPNCQNVMYDTGDIYSSLLSAIAISCQIVPSWESPVAPAGYVMRGSLYDLIAFKEHGNVEKDFPIGVTHCIRPDAADLATAVIGSAYGNPREWHILTTVTVNDVVCAEVHHGGNLAYFTH